MPNLYNRLHTRYMFTITHLHHKPLLPFLSHSSLCHCPTPLSRISLFNFSSYLSYQTSMATLPASTKQNNNQEAEEKLIPLDQNVLQKHVSFFDRNNDGIIYPWETYQGMRAIGCGVLLSAFAAIFINGGLSRKTRSGMFPSLLLAVEVKNIQKAKHGSDSGVYDSEGRFVPSKFEEIFIKHARSHPNALTRDELLSMLRDNREPRDYLGWLGSYSEWKMLYNIGKDKDGLLHKETIRGVYDGSLFEKMAKEHSEKKSK